MFKTKNKNEKMKNEKWKKFFYILTFLLYLEFYCTINYFFYSKSILFFDFKYIKMIVIHFVCTINTNIYYLFHKINHISWKIIEAKKLDFYFLTLSMFWQEYRKKKVINVFDTISIISILLARTYDLFHLFRLIAA